MGDHRARIKNCPVRCDVVTVDLSEDAPVFEVSVEGLVPRPYTSLHCEVLCRVAVVIWALDLVGVPDVAIVHLHLLARLEAVRKFIHKKFILFHLPMG